MSIDDVLRANEDRLMAIEGVVGVGIAEKDGVPAVSVMVTADTAEIKSQIPHELQGYPVLIEPIGEVDAFSR